MICFFILILNMMKYRAVVIGVSAGGMNVLGKILPALPADFPVPLIIVQHVSPHSDNYMIRYFDQQSQLTVKEADEKETIRPGHVYFAPPNYHLLIENDFTFSLSVEERVNFSRPSIDVLFETAADVWCPNMIGIILTGANNDGSKGLQKVKKCGGFTIVQDPGEAEAAAMPVAAIHLTGPDRILKSTEIAPLLIRMMKADPK